MLRRFTSQLGFLALMLSVGCTSVGRPWGIIRPASAPERNSRESGRSEESERRKEGERQPLIADTDRKRSGHDPATRMLIESELREAPAEEREEWLAYLDSVEAEMVPLILRARRIEKGQHDEKLAAVPPSGSILPAGHSANEASRTPAGRRPEGSPEQTPGPNAGSSTEHEPPPAGPATSGAPSPLQAAEGEEQQGEIVANGPNAPEPAAGLGWPKRIRSLREWESNPLWPGRGESETPSPPREKPKSDRGPFGLPQILGSSSKNESADASGQAIDPVRLAQGVTPGPVTPAGEMRIAPGAAHWEEELQKLTSLMEAEASSLSGETGSASREDVRKQVALRMLYLISNQPQLAQQAIPGIPSAEQEFWTSLFWALSDSLDEKRASDPAARATQAIAQLRSATHHLQQTARLQVRNIAFCERINSYGSYEQFERDEFSPGEPVLLYCEIRNFRSEPTSEGYYRTSIKSTVELYRGGLDGKLIDRNVFPSTEDLCRTLRSDYYHSYRIDLPTHLSPGPHVLKLNLQDELTGKLASETISFTVR